jgi:DNA-binding PadR family transcriptional regulator
MTNAELAILGLIIEQPMHGYQIEQIIDTRGMREWTDIGFSSIYYILKKLEERGLVTSQLEQADGRGPARKVLYPTDTGREEWYHRSLDTLREPALLPAPFLLGLSGYPAYDPAEARSALRNYLTKLEVRRTHLLERAEAQRPLPPHVTAMFSYSQAMIEAEIAWLKQFIAQVASISD